MDLISRQAATYSLSLSKEILSRVLDDIDVVGMDREKYSWGLRLIESHINYIEQLPSAQPELIRCRDCKYWQDQQEGVVEVPICARPENQYEEHPFRFIVGEDGFCSFAERKTDEAD